MTAVAGSPLPAAGSSDRRAAWIGGIVADEEVSLAENMVRAAMHPADQVEAFRRLADAGSTAAAIAARFGVSERTVEKRLHLGNAAPVLLDAYRAGEIDLDTINGLCRHHGSGGASTPSGRR